MSKGSLVIVGTGHSIGQITIEARSAIETAEKVFYVVDNPISEQWIKDLNSKSENLKSCYENGVPRIKSYLKMVEIILNSVREGLKVCGAFYGHPGVFVHPSHEAISQAQREGFNAEMLPGISAEDCLFADLGIDPSRSGCQTFEANDFLIYKRQFDTTSSLIIWQIGVIGDNTYKERGYSNAGLKILSDVLIDHYGPNFSVVIYEAPKFNICSPRMDRLKLIDLPNANVTAVSTLYIPPKSKREIDLEMLKKIGRKLEDIPIITSGYLKM